MTDADTAPLQGPAALMTPPRAAFRSPYDELAPAYDERYTDEASLSENETVKKLIVDHFHGEKPSTLDVGCGTGLLLDLDITTPDRFTGIDPSLPMLSRLMEKHPAFAELHHHLGQTGVFWLERHDRTYELVTALFGSASYLNDETWERMWAMTTHLLVLMAYVPGYLPDYYEGENREETLRVSAERSRQFLAFADRLPEAVVDQLGNFDVVTVRRA